MEEDEVKKNVESVFSEIDKFIDSVLKEEKIEERLIDYYTEFYDKMKEKVGTSSGFFGISEYLFFRAVLRSLEEKLNIQFKEVGSEYNKYWQHDKNGKRTQKESNTFSFYSQYQFKIRMTHSISIKQINEDLKKSFQNIKRPDIAIIKNDNELVAVFEIKIEKVSPSAFEKSIKDFEDLKNLSPRPLIFYIIFWPPEKNKKKKNRHEGLELIMEFFNK